MFVAMNRFKVIKGQEETFEDVWRNRESTLSEMAGFREFHLLKGPADDETGITLYVSHTIWADRESFLAWTRSGNFRNAHKNAGRNKGLYAGPPQFEGFEAVAGI